MGLDLMALQQVATRVGLGAEVTDVRLLVCVWQSVSAHAARGVHGEAYGFSHGVSGARRDRKASRSESNDELRWRPWLGLVAIKAGDTDADTDAGHTTATTLVCEGLEG